MDKTRTKSLYLVARMVFSQHIVIERLTDFLRVCVIVMLGLEQELEFHHCKYGFDV